MIENDTSIAFPQFFARPAVKVGGESVPYEVDGVTLRAIMIAANDFLPPDKKEKQCWDRQEAYQYRVIRQGDILFVDISEDIQYCGLKYVSVDSGAQYAISSDGRILRRLIGAEPEGPVSPAQPEAASQKVLTAPDAGADPMPPPMPEPAPPQAPDSGVPGTPP
ncbi:MAG: hypothetical protein ACJ8AT_38090 [Hyalangium sp.]|uniref:hypothetical protein n=1 Tax=Hyalangium sp. TaxID=2028555 RepID=UPI0038998149